jgi:glucose-6-phosphate isomerase
LAYGRQFEEIKQAGVPERLYNHLHLPGDRSSSMLLFEELNAFTLGQLLSIYEHRTTVSGFLWDVNSYDQYGVELGKVLGKNVRTFFQKNQSGDKPNFEGTKFNSATVKSLEWYLTRR